MVYDYVVVTNKHASTEDIFTQGRVVAPSKEIAILKIGTRLKEEDITNDLDVVIRPF